VSIHFNASVSQDAEGIEIFYYPTNGNERVRASRKLASYILYHVIDATEAVSRGVKKGNFHVIRETSMPAVLVEGGFVTHQGERSRLKDRGYLDKLAGGIAKGIDRYVKT
jgi:N-acetylmuramoyl-L-alanine amidase